VGQNYHRHIAELKSKKSKDPLLFLKPSTAILHEGEEIILPEFSNEVHHETELAFLVGKKGKNISRTEWNNYIIGAGIALDLTLRDVQREAKKDGNPWTISKGFDGSLPISQFVSLEGISDVQNLTIELYVNKKLRQKGFTGDMIWPVDELVSFISKIFTLESGDIILTGTPEGVGELNSGDHLKAMISEVGTMEFHVR
jgi:2-keto-4-pentenoate hydratase/2-oxohepta-3-ene-1,7-dioic acid hydratase in catechol pathway